MSTNVILRCRRRIFCHLLITFLTFELVKAFPITNNDSVVEMIFGMTSSSPLTSPATDIDGDVAKSSSTNDSSTIKNVTAKNKSLNDNTTDTTYDYEEVPTISNVTCDAWYEQICENGIECILKQFVCDGRRDCSDGSDEEADICQNQHVEDYPDSKGRFLPPTLKCPDTWFFCKDASRCVEPASACNGIDDCNDGSDEGGHCHYLNIERRLSSSSSSNETFQ